MDITIIIIIMTIVTILVLTYIYWFTKFGHNIVLERYVEAIAVLGTLIAIISLYVSYRSSQSTDKKQLELDLVKADESSIVETEKFFIENYPYLTDFYKELYSDNPYIQNMKVEIQDPIKKEMMESHAAQILLIKIETTYYTLGENENWDNSERTEPWIKLWSTWFKSPTLRKYWDYYKQFEDESVREFIDNTIIPLAMQHQASPVSLPSPASYKS